MAQEKKLQLQILDPTGEVVTTHHFYYNAGEGSRLRLTITDNTYIMNKDGKLVILTQEEITREEKRKEMLYTNRETSKPQKLFEILVPVFTVSYINPLVGDKGEALYITLEANSREQAIQLAMKNEEFTKHIYMKYFDEKYLNTFIPAGNYVIGKVDYYSGDPRL